MFRGVRRGAGDATLQTARSESGSGASLASGERSLRCMCRGGRSLVGVAVGRHDRKGAHVEGDGARAYLGGSAIRHAGAVEHLATLPGQWRRKSAATCFHVRCRACRMKYASRAWRDSTSSTDGSESIRGSGQRSRPPAAPSAPRAAREWAAVRVPGAFDAIEGGACAVDKTATRATADEHARAPQHDGRDAAVGRRTLARRASPHMAARRAAPGELDKEVLPATRSLATAARQHGVAQRRTSPLAAARTGSHHAVREAGHVGAHVDRQAHEARHVLEAHRHDGAIEGACTKKSERSELPTTSRRR